MSNNESLGSGDSINPQAQVDAIFEELARKNPQFALILPRFGTSIPPACLDLRRTTPVYGTPELNRQAEDDKWAGQTNQTGLSGL